MVNHNRIARLAALTVLSFTVGVACGDEECVRGTTECVNDNMLRTCLPSDDGNVWLVTQCGANFTCLSDPSLLLRQSNAEDDAGVQVGPKGMRAPDEPACVGCDVGAHECLSDALARYCVSGGIWALDMCGVGEKCSDDLGVCRVGEGKGSVSVCEPGAMACASKKVAKVCDADGSDWVEEQCAANEKCDGDHCVPDPASSCDKGDTCLDNKTAVHCLSRAEGYKLEECSGDLYCEEGRCRGSACAVGAVCVGTNQVRECVAGNSYRDTQCGVNEICMEDQLTAKCVPLQCSEGTSSCGDPRDAGVDARKYFTTCVKGDGSGIPEWVRGECAGTSSCDPAQVSMPGKNPCSQQCTKGAQRCASDSLSGVNDGIQTCGDDGKWGPVKSCNTGTDTQLQCALASNPDASQLPKAVCAEPICQWVLSNPMLGAKGTCEGGELRKCQADGKLSAAASCESGVCGALSGMITADGRKPGACTEKEECEDGEQQCSGAGTIATPRYRTCQGGVWGTELMTCKNDALCYTGRDAKNLRKALCGAQCSPGSRRCNQDGSLESCDDNGRWGGGNFCDRGACKQLDNNDAACVLDCMPGERVCSGSSNVMSGDGYHTGYSEERVCNDDGHFEDSKACATDSVCRVASTGVAVGCVACVGPKVPGGNQDHTADSRCEPNNTKNLQECGDDNTWVSGRACSGSKMCVNPTSGSCGTCKVAGMDVTCTEANIKAKDMNASCDSLMYGAPAAWGGMNDCCTNYHKGKDTTSSFAYCQ